jgi:hypothetical protein
MSGSHSVKVETASKLPRRLFVRATEFVGFSLLSFSRRIRQSAL